MLETYYKIEQYRQLDQQVKALTKQKDKLNEELKQTYFAQHKEFIYEGRLLMELQTQLRVTVDTKLITLEHPDFIKQYQRINEIKLLLLK
jgi:predicted phage-related endonuclease